MKQSIKKLPIGIQTFEKLIKGNHLYIDKTELIYRLINNGFAYFLSRPRRFGKSLLISTLDEIFKGNKELFKDLWIYESDYEWKEFPVIRIDFSKQGAENKEDLKRHIKEQLDVVAYKYDIELSRPDYYSRFEELIAKLGSIGKVVILIDEYDKPLIDHITETDAAIGMREVLKGFYTIIKAMDAHVRFVLLTGVSKFSKAGVFSGLNNLNDISMTADHSALLGITQNELEYYFEDRISNMAEEENIEPKALLEEIKHWYNGYCFSEKCTQVYNPYSTLMLFDHRSFRNYWFETGTPSFLVNLMQKQSFKLHDIHKETDTMSFSTYEIERLRLTPLLFQCGYLTIKAFNKDRMLYTLDYPNFEVKNSFLTYIANFFSNYENSKGAVYEMTDALKTGSFDQFFQILKTFFANIDYDLHLNYEKYYQTIFYVVFQLIGLNIKAEVKTNIGRIDAVIDGEAIYLFEFKFNGTKEEALSQIIKKEYLVKYLGQGKPVFAVGVAFVDKNIKDWEIKELNY